MTQTWTAEELARHSAVSVAIRVAPRVSASEKRSLQYAPVRQRIARALRGARHDPDYPSYSDFRAAYVGVKALLAGRALTRRSLASWRVHSISGYEWECDECHWHFQGRECWRTGVVADRDGEVDGAERPVDHDRLVSLDQVLALL